MVTVTPAMVNQAQLFFSFVESPAARVANLPATRCRWSVLDYKPRVSLQAEVFLAGQKETGKLLSY